MCFLTSAIARRREKVDKDESDVEKDEKPEVKEKTPIKKEPEPEVEPSPKKEVKEDNDNSAKEETEDVEMGDDQMKLSARKSFIKLNCPHCGVKAVTFWKYEQHLQSRTHLLAMRKVAMKQKSILAQMRLAQRNAQNELEKTSEDLVTRTNFCPLCKLNYKQRKSVHQVSEAHKNMKKFLMPYCKVCNITFKSPMIYESHCCSIEHLKRKQRVENCDSDDLQEEEDNLEDFTTIDSVGIEEKISEDDNKKDIVKEPINVGMDQIHKVEAYYCDLCRVYLTRGSEDEIADIIAKHCKQRMHMQRYIRYKEDKDLEKRAEKLQRKEIAEKENKERLEKDGTDNNSSTKQENNVKENEDKENKNTDDEEARDDKLWADVDKDLGDILAEAESGNKSSDEDEDINGERYDRFGYSDKNGDDGTEKKIIADDASNNKKVEDVAKKE